MNCSFCWIIKGRVWTRKYFELDLECTNQLFRHRLEAWCACASHDWCFVKLVKLLQPLSCLRKLQVTSLPKVIRSVSSNRIKIYQTKPGEANRFDRRPLVVAVTWRPKNSESSKESQTPAAEKSAKFVAVRKVDAGRLNAGSPPFECLGSRMLKILLIFLSKCLISWQVAKMHTDKHSNGPNLKLSHLLTPVPLRAMHSHACLSGTKTPRNATCYIFNRRQQQTVCSVWVATWSIARAWPLQRNNPAPWLQTKSGHFWHFKGKGYQSFCLVSSVIKAFKFRGRPDFDLYIYTSTVYTTS